MRKTKVFFKCIAVCIAMLMSIGIILPSSVLAVSNCCPPTPQQVKYTVNFVDKEGHHIIAPPVEKTGTKGSWVYGSDEAISINGYEFFNSIPEKIKLSNDGNNLTLVYEELYDYQVNYYHEGTTTKISPTVTGEAKKGAFINTWYQVKSIFGYSYTDRTPDYWLQISSIEANNIINIYYCPEAVQFTVKHVVQATGELLGEETLSGSHNTSVTVNANSYTGYTATNAPLTVTPKEGEENVFTVYYEANPVEYTVKHVVQATGELLDEETLSGSHNTSVTVNANSYTGYTATNAPLTVTPKEGEENVYTVYYAANEVEYKVKHVVQATGELLDEETLSGSHNMPVTINANSYTGYTAINAPLSATPKEGEENVFTVYYEANEVEYTVKHVVQATGELLDEETLSGSHNTPVTVNANSYIGYTATNAPFTVTPMEEEENVFTVYYEANEVEYTVKHVVQATGELLDEETLSGSHNTSVTINANSYTGYTAINAPLSATPKEGEENVFTVYYEANEVEYTVKHVVQATGELLDEETLSGSHNTPVTVNANSYIGYTATNAPFTVTPMEDEENVFTVYYAANDVDYTVKYVEQGNPSHELAPTDTFTGKHGEKVDIDAKDIEGYTVTQLTQSITPMEGEANELVFEYTPNLQVITIKFLEQGTDKELKAPLALNAFFGVVIYPVDPGNIIEGYDYVSKTPDKLVIGANNDDNVIIYYFAASEQQYTVKYLKRDDNTPVAPEKVATGVVGQEITESPIDVEGYSPVDESDVTITIDKENNTIIFYYEEIEIKVLGEEATFDNTDKDAAVTPQAVTSGQETNPQTGEYPYDMSWLVWMISAIAATMILFVYKKKQAKKE